LTKIKYTLQFFFEAVSKLNEEACGDRPHPNLNINCGLPRDILNDTL